MIKKLVWKLEWYLILKPKVCACYLYICNGYWFSFDSIVSCNLPEYKPTLIFAKITAWLWRPV